MFDHYFKNGRTSNDAVYLKNHNPAPQWFYVKDLLPPPRFDLLKSKDKHRSALKSHYNAHNHKNDEFHKTNEERYNKDYMSQINLSTNELL